MIILVNGPPRSGKDTFYRFAKQWVTCQEYKMSSPLKRGLAAFFGWSGEDAKHIEEYKDQTSAFCFGKTFRETQISLSEEWAKVQWGADIFGRIAVNRIDDIMCPTVIVTDSGFQIEANTMIKGLGYGRCALVTLSRPDCTFEGDSREPISPDSFKLSHHIDNSFDLMLYEQQVKKCLIKFGVIANE